MGMKHLSWQLTLGLWSWSASLLLCWACALRRVLTKAQQQQCYTQRAPLVLAPAWPRSRPGRSEVATSRSVTEWSCRRTGVIITRGEYNTLSKSVYIAARGRSRKDNSSQVELTWRAFYFGKWFRPSVGFVGEFFAILLKFFWKKNILLHTNSLYFFFKRRKSSVEIAKTRHNILKLRKGT